MKIPPPPIPPKGRQISEKHKQVSNSLDIPPPKTIRLIPFFRNDKKTTMEKENNKMDELSTNMDTLISGGISDSPGQSSWRVTSQRWNEPEMVCFIEKHDSLEVIYKEEARIIITTSPAKPPPQRVFKIVFSCVDGEWNRSERIYGEIIPAKEEEYVFNGHGF